jgi:hypothetical protein
MKIFTKAFWSYAGERAVKTVAQTAIAALTVGGVTGVLDVAWVPLASGVALAGLVSVLTSIVGYSDEVTVTPAQKDQNADLQAATARVNQP